MAKDLVSEQAVLLIKMAKYLTSEQAVLLIKMAKNPASEQAVLLILKWGKKSSFRTSCIVNIFDKC